MAFTTAAIAGGAAAAAYLDAKYHIRKDLRVLQEMRSFGKMAEKLGKENKRSVWYLFEKQVNAHPDEQCLWYRSQPSEPAITYTWRETYQHCCRYAQFMLQHGVQPGQLITMYLVNSPEFMMTLTGSLAIGSAPAMINYHLSGDALIASLKTPRSKLLFVDEDAACRERIEQVRSRIENELGMEIIVLDAETKAQIAAMEPTRPGDEYRKDVGPSFPIFLFYTSGTTGYPKACAFPTASGYPTSVSKMRTAGIGVGDTWYDCMPLYHGTGCVTAVGCLTGGNRLAIGRKFSVRNFWQDIHDSEAHGFIYVGETARYLLAAPPSPLDKDHKLKAMYGNGMRPDVWRKFMDRFNIPCVNEFFNSTEGMLSLINICRSPFHDTAVGHHGAIRRFMLRNHLVPVEIDHESGDISRDPKTGFARRKPYEEGGEILVACNSQADFVGYWNNQEATDKRFARDVFKKGDLFYRTGDALRRDTDGRWYL